MTIRAENLTKRYRQGEKEVVALLSFTYAFPPGATAVVGPSGSGKTTLLNLLAGFDLPTEGGVYLGDIPLHALSEDERAGVRLRHMGFVFQQNFLFAGTIAENVKSPRPDATDEEIRQAFRDLDCLDLIEDLPAGIHTPCSEKGRGLSMGQQQLVAFARALLADPRILILDEATSALDPDSEAIVNANIRKIARGRDRLDQLGFQSIELWLSQGKGSCRRWRKCQAPAAAEAALTRLWNACGS